MSTDAEDTDVAAEEWPRVVRLKHPVQFGNGEPISELTFRRGKLGDLKGVALGDVPPVEQLSLIASRMCGQSIKVIEMLDGEDSPEVIAIALVFFAKSLPTIRRP